MDATMLRRAVDLATANAAAGADLPDLRYPAPDALPGVDTEHVPVDGAAEPFARYLAAGA